jgi:tetratricopeptide (TPR) repeat protein
VAPLVRPDAAKFGADAIGWFSYKYRSIRAATPARPSARERLIMEWSPNPLRRRRSSFLAGLAAAWLVATVAAGQDTAVTPSPADGTGNTAAEAAVRALRSQRFAEALRVVDEALAPLVATKGNDDREVLTLLILKGQACYGLGRPQEAIDALAPFARSLPTPGPLVAPTSDWNALTVLGDSFMAIDRWSDALGCLERARAMLAADGAGDPRSKAINTATTLGKIGTARARLEDWPGAREAFEEQVAALEAEDGGGRAYLAAARNGLGLVADNLGDHAAAAEQYALAAAIYEEQFGLEHPYTKRALTTLARVKGKVGDTQEADRITARLATVDALSASIPPTLQPVPPTIPDQRAATPMPLVTWPVIFAATAAVILVALFATGFLGRRMRRADGDPGGGLAEEEAVVRGGTEND